MKNIINFSLAITIFLAAVVGCSSTSKERTQFAANQSKVAVILNKTDSSPTARSFTGTSAAAAAAKSKTNSVSVKSEYANLSQTANQTSNVVAVVPAPEPATSHSGASAKCRDGSLSYSAHRRGTCSHHGGVAVWY